MTGGRPNGMFVGAAKSLIEKVVPAPLPKERDLAFAKAQQNLLSQGVTAIADMGTTIDDWQAFRRAGDRGNLRIRIISYAAGIGNMLRSEEHTSELQSLMRISYAVFCLKKKQKKHK